jgi:hypothetical protein
MGSHLARRRQAYVAHDELEFQRAGPIYRSMAFVKAFVLLFATFCVLPIGIAISCSTSAARATGGARLTVRASACRQPRLKRKLWFASSGSARCDGAAFSRRIAGADARAESGERLKRSFD